MKNRFPERFYLLDIMRGFASLSVVIWHYQHFFFSNQGALPEGFDRSTQPLYEIFWLFYEHGLQAVQLFFVLSGFIFFWLYFDKVKDGVVSPKEYFVLRFSRLYPLHFATLILVALAQWVSQKLNGHSVIFDNNDLNHFVLNLFFASHWGFQEGFSFNAPSWSISVEIVLYVLFLNFVLAARTSVSAASILMMAVLMIAVFFLKDGSQTAFDILVAIFCFFAGGGTYRFFHFLRNTSLSRKSVICLTTTITGIALSIFYIARSSSEHVLLGVLYLAVFPSLVLLLASLQDLNHLMGKRYRIIGDITYSTYLLHFPLQVIFITFTAYYAVKIDYRSEVPLLAFLAALIILSVMSYKIFEIPSQRYLRRRLIRK